MIFSVSNLGVAPLIADHFQYIFTGKNHYNFWTNDAIIKTFWIYNDVKLYNIVYFMTGCGIYDCLGLATP